MKCQKCYWYNPQADGSGCIQGYEVPPPGCPDFCEDWELLVLAEVSPTDPRLRTAVGAGLAGGRGGGGGGMSKVRLQVYRIRAMTDEQINDCRRSNGGNCQTCPDKARCLELFERELARHLSLEPPEEVEEWLKKLTLH